MDNLLPVPLSTGVGDGGLIGVPLHSVVCMLYRWWAAAGDGLADRGRSAPAEAGQALGLIEVLRKEPLHTAEEGERTGRFRLEVKKFK